MDDADDGRGAIDNFQVAAGCDHDATVLKRSQRDHQRETEEAVLCLTTPQDPSHNGKQCVEAWACFNYLWI